MRISKRRLRQMIREEVASTKKYDDDSALTGKQSNLPDALQRGIIDKAVKDRDLDEEDVGHPMLSQEVPEPEYSPEEEDKIRKSILGSMAKNPPHTPRSNFPKEPTLGEAEKELGESMKITKRQLKRIIREAVFSQELHDRYAAEDAAHDDKGWEDSEWERGYQDGLNGVPPADNATTTYDAGYEDGTNDADGSDPGQGVH